MLPIKLSKPKLSLSLIMLFSSMALSLPVAAENVLPSTMAMVSPEADSPVVKKRKRVRRNQALTEAETKDLLEQIPENHPRRGELRMIVLQGPPEGYSAQEWLNLSMGVDFRSAGSAKVLSQQTVE
jgi:hypothetical protein